MNDVSIHVPQETNGEEVSPVRGALTPEPLAEEATPHEQLSALADGQLQGSALVRAVDFSATQEGQATWALYHLVGDVLRSPELAHRPRNNDLLAAVRAHMAQEPLPTLQSSTLTQVAAPETRAPTKAANASVFRWKMVAGFASVAAVSAIGWSVALQWHAASTPAAQLAAVAPATVVPQAVRPSVGRNDMAGLSSEQPYMLRDPRLDELLAAHKQYGSTTALQMPAGFLRNATFEAPARNK